MYETVVQLAAAEAAAMQGVNRQGGPVLMSTRDAIAFATMCAAVRWLAGMFACTTSNPARDAASSMHAQLTPVRCTAHVFACMHAALINDACWCNTAVVQEPTHSLSSAALPVVRSLACTIKADLRLHELRHPPHSCCCDLHGQANACAAAELGRVTHCSSWNAMQAA
jgi:hypothetical protein